jgi:hypothetical protein
MRRRLGSSSAAFQIALQLAAAILCRPPGSAQPAPLDVARPAAAAASGESRRTARASYTAGVAAFQRSAYAEAAALFARADELSSSPNAKLMLGRCLRQLGRPTDAYRALVESVHQSEKTDPMRYARTRAAAQAELETIREQIGLLTVFVHAGRGSAYLHVEGQPVPRGEWQTPLPVPPGRVKLSLETLPGVIEHREVEILAGQTATVVIGTPTDTDASLELGRTGARPRSLERSVSSSASSLRTASYIVGGTGAAGLIAFGVLGALSESAYEELDRRCGDRRRCDPDLAPIADRGELMQTSANIALVVGAAALGIGIGLFAISGDSESSERSTTIAVSPTGIELRGRH